MGMKTRVFYAIKTERVSLQNNYDGLQPFITENKTKQNKTENKNKDAPRITHIIRSNKKWSALRNDLIFWWWKWGCFGASPSSDACTSWIFLGLLWASPSLSFCPYFISSYHPCLPTLENFLHTKLITILISNVSAIKIINPLGSGMTHEKHPFKH